MQFLLNIKLCFNGYGRLRPMVDKVIVSPPDWLDDHATTDRIKRYRYAFLGQNSFPTEAEFFFRTVALISN